MISTTWLKPETAPRDGDWFIGDIGFPFPFVMCWNEYMEQFVFCNYFLNHVDGCADPYFEHDYANSNELKRWQPLPDLNA